MNKLLEKLKILLLLLQKFLRQKVTIPNLSKPKHIVVHYGAGNLDFDGINRYHEMIWGFKSSLGFFCGYHYFMQLNAIIFQARADNEEGAHCVESGKPGYWNKNSIGICMMGDDTKFTEDMQKELKRLLDRLRIKYGIPYSEVYGHRDIKPTACPGNKVYNYIISYKKPVR